MNDLNFLNKYKQRRIIIAPLNWGLGHATRCVPLIKELSKNNDVLIASDGIALDWLQQEFPTLSTITLPSYGITYKSTYMWLNMMRSSPALIHAIRKEHNLLQKLIVSENIDLVISDHRLGLYTHLCECVIMAHQISIPHNNPILKGIISSLNKGYLNRYNQVWIPDYKDEKKALAGAISRSHGLNSYRYIGPLSRLKFLENKKRIDVLFILSGPEPSRTNFEDDIIALILNMDSKKSISIIRGTSTPNVRLKDLSHIEVIDFANTSILNSAISSSDKIVCRSGYSSIMDLHILDKSACLLPTPSQPEQEYLGLYHQEKKSHTLIYKLSELVF